MTRLATHIKKAGLTQATFAKLYGFPPPMVCQWASGDRLPGRDNAERLERIAGIPVSYWKSVGGSRRRKS